MKPYIKTYPYVWYGSDGDYSNVFLFTCCGKSLNSRDGVSSFHPYIDDDEVAYRATFKFCPYCGTFQDGINDVREKRHERHQYEVGNFLKFPNIYNKYIVYSTYRTFSMTNGEEYDEEETYGFLFHSVNSFAEFCEEFSKLKRDNEKSCERILSQGGEIKFIKRNFHIRRRKDVN